MNPIDTLTQARAVLADAKNPSDFVRAAMSHIDAALDALQGEANRLKRATDKAEATPAVAPPAV
jgi:hypothetical protein